MLQKTVPSLLFLHQLFHAVHVSLSFSLYMKMKRKSMQYSFRCNKEAADAFDASGQAVIPDAAAADSERPDTLRLRSWHSFPSFSLHSLATVVAAAHVSHRLIARVPQVHSVFQFQCSTFRSFVVVGGMHPEALANNGK